MKSVLVTADAANPDNALILLLGGVLVILLSVVSAWYSRERTARLAAQHRAAQAELALASRPAPADQQAEQLAHQRNQVMFEQHRRINQLTIDKLEAEVQLMQAQLALRATMKDREEAGREVHELMVEKTKLEIDSLRLHIAELRKRMEDWNSD